MENANKGNQSRNDEASQRNSTNPNQQEKVVNQQEQNRAVNTGDEEFKENVTGRSPERSPRDLNLSGSGDTNTSNDTPGGAEIETPHKHEGEDEESTERKMPKM